MSKVSLTAALLALSVAAQAQTCNTAMPRKAPDSRYTVQAGGAEVQDTQTGLIWQRCSLDKAGMVPPARAAPGCTPGKAPCRPPVTWATAGACPTSRSCKAWWRRPVTARPLTKRCFPRPPATGIGRPRRMPTMVTTRGSSTSTTAPPPPAISTLTIMCVWFVPVSNLAFWAFGGGGAG